MSKKPTATAEKKAAPPAPSKVEGAAASTNHAKSPVNAGLSREAKIELHRKMVRIRRFEERSLLPIARQLAHPKQARR